MTSEINHQNAGDVTPETTRYEIAQFNTERLETLAKSLGKKVSELDVSDFNGGTASYKCVECLENKITAGNIVYTGNQGNKIKCFKCQYK